MKSTLVDEDIYQCQLSAMSIKAGFMRFCAYCFSIHPLC